jgi:predicted phosphoribosyltransferase
MYQVGRVCKQPRPDRPDDPVTRGDIPVPARGIDAGSSPGTGALAAGDVSVPASGAMSDPTRISTVPPSGGRMSARFRNRAEAGQVLATRLSRYAGMPGAIVLALPRGGVPVGYEVAVALGLPLDVLVVRKLGVPGHEELAMGAIAGGATVLNDEVVEALGIPESVIRHVEAAERRELERRELRYRGERPYPEISGRTILVVDDGLATGSTMRAAIGALRAAGPERIVAAAPTGAKPSVAGLAAVADEVVVAATPSPFIAVGQAYKRFDQTADEEVARLLRAAADRPAPD